MMHDHQQEFLVYTCESFLNDIIVDVKYSLVNSP